MDRIAFENNPINLQNGGLTRSWTNIIASRLSDADKQAILNDLIEDKVLLMEQQRAEKLAQEQALNATITELNNDKE